MNNVVESNVVNRFVFIASWLVAVLAGCQSEEKTAVAVTPPSQAVAELKVDEDHNHAMGNEAAKTYQVEPSSSVKLNLKGYSLPQPEGAPKAHAIHAVCGPNYYFRQAFTSTAVVVLDRSSATAVKGQDFVGLPAGQECMVAIGTDNFPTKQMQFAPLWAGIVKVAQE